MYFEPKRLDMVPGFKTESHKVPLNFNSLGALDECGRRPAHLAARSGHSACLAALLQFDGPAMGLVKELGWKSAHYAAEKGHLACLKLAATPITGPDAGKIIGRTLQLAAQHSHEPCVHYMLDESFQILYYHKGIWNRTVLLRRACIDSDSVELTKEDWGKIVTSGFENWKSLAYLAADAGHLKCLLAMQKYQPSWLKPLHDDVCKDPGILNSKWKCMLTVQNLLNLKCKRRWLQWALADITDIEEPLSIVAKRDNLLGGLHCSLGVDMDSGSVLESLDRQPLTVIFVGENAFGDGVRREWFSKVAVEMLNQDMGLFMSKDGGRTLHPNPHSATAVEPNHLSWFAILGRITGLALFHNESLNVHWTLAFVKVAFGFSTDVNDLQSVDPELFRMRVAYLRDSKYVEDNIELADFGLTFVDDSNGEAYSEHVNQLSPIELEPSGANIAVTAVNKMEYLQLLVENRLVKSISPQIKAFQAGLQVFVTPPDRQVTPQLLHGRRTAEFCGWHTTNRHGRMAA
jgi:E3 ubiquitin-protein ligase HACE1